TRILVPCRAGLRGLKCSLAGAEINARRLVRFINYRKLGSSPIQTQVQIVPSALPGNTVGDYQTIDHIIVGIGIAVARIAVVSIKAHGRKCRPACSLKTYGSVPVGTIDRASDAVAINPVQADVEMIHQIQTNEIVPPCALIVSKERREESGVQGLWQRRLTVNVFI